MPERSFRPTRFSVVVPCYNEAQGISFAIDRLLKFLNTEADHPYEVILVDDGSTDGTGDVLQRFSAERDGAVRVVTHEKNAGLTAAMRTGAGAASYEILTFLDADLSYVPETISALIAAKVRTQASLAVASPYMDGGKVGNVPLFRLLASRGANWLLSLTVGRTLRTFTGMVRAYDTELFRTLASDPGPGEFNAAMVAAHLRHGAAIVEVPAALIWPARRAEGPSRISWNSLWQRTKLVIATLKTLARSGQGSVKKRKYGPLVLVWRPKVSGPQGKIHSY